MQQWWLSSSRASATYSSSHSIIYHSCCSCINSVDDTVEPELYYEISLLILRFYTKWRNCHLAQSSQSLHTGDELQQNLLTLFIRRLLRSLEAWAICHGAIIGSLIPRMLLICACCDIRLVRILQFLHAWVGLYEMREPKVEFSSRRRKYSFRQ